MKQIHGGNLKDVSRQYGIPETEIIDFSVSINPLGTPRAAIKAILDEMERLTHYPEIDSLSFREKIAEKDRIPVDHILAGNGSTEFIYLLPRILAPKKALIVSPTYSEYERALLQTGTDVSHFLLHKEDQFVMDLDRLIEKIKDGMDLVVLCNPNNPTGSLVPLPEVKSILSAARFTRSTVLIDEAFMDFVLGESARFQVMEYENLLVLRSLGAFYAIPGLRAGCLYGSGDFIARIREHQEPWTVNRLSQAAAAASLMDEEFRQNSLARVREERTYLTRELDSIPGIRTFPSSANFLLFEISPPMPEPDRLFEALVHSGILVRNGASFPALGPHFFRVAVREHEENVQLVEGIRKSQREMF